MTCGQQSLLRHAGDLRARGTVEGICICWNLYFLLLNSIGDASVSVPAAGTETPGVLAAGSVLPMRLWLQAGHSSEAGLHCGRHSGIAAP